MADQSTQAIVIQARPASVMAAIADFDNYPVWAASVKRCEVLERGDDGRAVRVAFVLDAGVVRDQYELAYTWDGDQRVDWAQVKGQMMRSQRGSYTLDAVGDTTHVTYALAVDLAIPMLGMLKRKAERIVMDTALKELKRHVESAPS
jgi:carbon monoxide dehydrogenase subunit G